MTRKEDVTLAEKYDDYALSRVPQSERKHWFGIATMRFGQISALSQFLLGAALGFGMDFWSAFWAVTLGSVILEIVSIFVGIAGMKEGLSTTLLVRWAGFGKVGSILLSLVISISMVGWFGIQNEVFANGIHQILGGPVWMWSIVTGLAVTFVVLFGILSLGITAYITVPLFLLVVFYSISTVLTKFSFGELISLPTPGPTISIAMGASMVAGGFIAGAIITPDMSRFNRSVGDVVKQTVIGITIGEYLIGMIGVILAHVAKSSDVISIVMGTSGIIGTIVLITATLKINDWNLYSSSLGVVNLIDLGFGKRVNRTVVTIILGIAGTLFSVMGILEQFQGFLILLGVALPPVGGILTMEYFVVKRYKRELEESRAKGVLPESYEAWNPITLIAWAAAIFVGLTIDWGIPSVNSLVVGGLVYWLISLVVNRNKVVTYGSVNTYEQSSL
ncbi:cytosine permease [Neobacillus notoginsengisoli]|uniref:Cytosine permease n=1 Tax=Neobacillus notoginsengisoli TaxID=1578198 RepID=A0A417YYK0_9BACI|nr:cytosine permease [Neobacillus notoginsengisoli]RHW42816.1 cytosine permease [Neobacillus notoginsengisoli]